MNAPRVAVVVPVFDGERHLAATLASVAAQTLAPHEVIVVDDGSRDASADVAARAGARVLRQANAGPGAARNRGVAATDCELVAFLDADDLFAPDKLARQVEALAAAPDVMAVCSDATILGGERDGQRRSGGRRVPARLRFGDLLDANPVIASSVLARRAAVLAAGGFDEDPVSIATEDYDLWLRMLDRPGAAFAYLDAPLVRYRMAGGSLSASARFLHGLDRIFAKLDAAHPGDPAIARAGAKRRAQARLDAAWDELRAGAGRQARAFLREARALGGSPLAGWRMWLRSWFAGRRSR